jgi:hypothetical protein
MTIQKIDGGPAVVRPWPNRAITPTSGDRYRNPSAKVAHRFISRLNFCS